MAVYKSKRATKDGRSYFFRIKYKDIFEETHDYTSQKFKTRKEAVDEEARYRIKVDNKDVLISNITVEKIYYELLEEKKKMFKKQTIIRYGYLFRHLEPLKKEKINDINISKYKKFLIELEKKNVDNDYRNKVLGLLRNIIAYSSKYYNTSDSLLKFIENYKSPNKMKKEMQFFTYEEYKQFDNVINEHEWHTFFEVLYFMGIRQGECQGLMWKDVDFEKGTLNINKTLTTKLKGEEYTISSPKTKNSKRVLPIPQNLLEDIRFMYNNAVQYNDYSNTWFIFGNSIPFKETTIQKHKNNYCKKADVKQIRIHDFRHSCASLLINQGASITLVSKWLGHSNISITLNTYTHLYKSELANILDTLNNLKN